MNSNQNKEGNLLIDLESISKFIALLLGILYIFGILIRNTYLLQIGVAEFTFLQVQYIYRFDSFNSNFYLFFFLPNWDFYSKRSSTFNKNQYIFSRCLQFIHG